jgi:hypothetical protein
MPEQSMEVNPLGARHTVVRELKPRVS